MQLFLKIIVIVILFTSATSDCLQTVSTGNWTILSDSIISYGIGRDYEHLPNLAGHLIGYITCEEKQTICNLTSSISESQTGPIFQRSKIKTFLKNLLERKSLQQMDIFQLTFNYNVYVTALANGHLVFSQGYYYDEGSSILHLWSPHTNPLLVFHEGPAEEEILNSNTSARFITFKDNENSYTLQLAEQNIAGYFETDQPFLHLTNSSQRDRFSSYLKLSQNIFPKNNWTKCEIVPKTLPLERRADGVGLTDLIILTLLIAFSVIAACSIYRCVLCGRRRRTRNRPEALRLSFFKRIRDHGFYKYFRHKNQTGSSDTVYEEPMETNIYEEPGSSQQKVYDLKGNRVQLKNQEQKQGKPDYDYAYSTSKQGVPVEESVESHIGTTSEAYLTPNKETPVRKDSTASYISNMTHNPYSTFKSEVPGRKESGASYIDTTTV